MTIRVTVVDDDADAHVAIRGLLATVDADVDVGWIGTYHEALRAMAEDDVDVFIVGEDIAGASGVGLLAEARSKGGSAPVVILSDQGDQVIDLAAAEAGAAGFLVRKDLDAVNLERSIRYAAASRRSGRRPSRPGDLLLQMALARGATVREAARLAGVSERTAHRRNTDPEFRAEVDRLRAELKERLMTELVHRMVDDQ